MEFSAKDMAQIDPEAPIPDTNELRVFREQHLDLSFNETLIAMQQKL